MRFVENLSILQPKRKYGLVDFGEDDSQDAPQMDGQTEDEFQLDEITPVWDGDTADHSQLDLRNVPHLSADPLNSKKNRGHHYGMATDGGGRDCHGRCHKALDYVGIKVTNAVFVD